MQQKDIYLANLNPTKGSEQSGTRPIVIISGDTLNENLDICITCPISSQVKNYAACVFLKKSPQNGLKEDSEIITFQVRTISKNRLIKKVGTISDDELKQITEGLNDVIHY